MRKSAQRMNIRDNGGVAIGFSSFDSRTPMDIADYCIIIPTYATLRVESLHVVLASNVHLFAREYRKRKLVKG